MDKTFQDHLNETGAVGSISSIVQSIVYVSGLPGVRPKEMVIGQGGQRGIVQSLEVGLAEVLMLDTFDLTSNLKIARTNETLTIPAGEGLIGRLVDHFGRQID